jgi:hypothetical protein
MAGYRGQWSMLAAAVLGGYGLGQLSSSTVQLAGIASVALAIIVGTIRHSRIQASRRWRAALDAYADRAVARQRRRIQQNARVA